MSGCAIKILVMDVDGTLTDGKIYMGSEGEVMKAFDAKDGLGIRRILPTLDIAPIVITGRKSAIVERRCGELGIESIFQGVDDKLQKLKLIVDDVGCDLRQVAYVGDDLNDWDCMRAVSAAGGIVGCPADAVDAVKGVSDFVSSRSGGDGVVREFIDHIQKLSSV